VNGTSIELEGQRLQIVGVLPEGVRIPGAPTDLCLPLTLDPAAVPRKSHYLHALARLRDGLTAKAAQRELAVGESLTLAGAGVAVGLVGALVPHACSARCCTA
jgi:hypothetical protein